MNLPKTLKPIQLYTSPRESNTVRESYEAALDKTII